MFDQNPAPLLTEVLPDQIGQDHTAMSATGTADGHGETGLPFGLELRQKEIQEFQELLAILLGGRPP